jgi:hypothetical protein
MLTEIASCGELFHTAIGTVFAYVLVATGKPGPSAAIVSGARCVAAITKPPEGSAELDLLEARAQFDAPERAIAWPKTKDASISIWPTTAGVRSKSDPKDGA